MVVLDDGRQVSAHVSAAVERSTECKSLVQQRRHTMPSSIRAKLPEVAEACDLPVDEDGALGTAGDPGDPAADRLASDHRLMYIAFDGRGDGAVRLPFQCQCDVSGQRMFTQETTNLRVISGFSKPDVESWRR
jgi:hypothetical protein